jgi:Fur family transcriptional regulator, peroxide stress response regulator
LPHYDAPVRNTRQRKYMLELLKATDAHPSAQWLFEKMKPEFPHLSFSTVYRNLGILEKEGALQRLTCGNAFDRYDGNAAPHSHFFCRRCGAVYDVDLGPVENTALSGVNRCEHSIEGCSVTFYGICENCRKANNIKE